MKQNFLKKYIQVGWGVNPHSDWARLLNICFACAIVLFISCLILLYTIRHDLIFQVDPEKENDVSVTHELHDRIKRSFRQKQEKTFELQTQSTGIQDMNR